MILSGAPDTYTANACAQVASTSNAWVQVIAPGANAAGIYVSHVFCLFGAQSAQYRAHTALPASDADGVGFAHAGGTSTSTGAVDPNCKRADVGAIIPAGQGLYCKSDQWSSIFYRVL